MLGLGGLVFDAKINVFTFCIIGVQHVVSISIIITWNVVILFKYVLLILMEKN